MKQLILPFFALVLVACGGPTYKTTLSGANEKPNAVTSNGAGSVTAVLDGAKLDVTGNYSTLSGPATNAHIHGPADAANTGGVVCPLTVTEGANAGTGTLAGSCDISETASATTLTAANLNAGMYYVNVHTTLNPGGEIRGQLAKQ